MDLEQRAREWLDIWGPAEQAGDLHISLTALLRSVAEEEREALYAHFTEVAIDAVRKAAAIRARAKE